MSVGTLSSMLMGRNAQARHEDQLGVRYEFLQEAEQGFEHEGRFVLMLRRTFGDLGKT